jgi:outer membrane protein assembly factor BamB
MRALALLVAGLTLAGVAAGAPAPEVVTLPKPPFPAPATGPATPSQLELVSSRRRDPAFLPSRPQPPDWAPRAFHGSPLQLAIRQRGTVFLAYGRDGSSVRFLVAVRSNTRDIRYALDLDAYGRPPRGGGWYESLVWARERDAVLYVSHAHLTYASATRRRNAYVSAIDLHTFRLLWRSPSLVANAASFVVAGDAIVSGYGFTAERDYLYVLDRRTGRVSDRLALPTAPEWVKLRGDRLHVRTYDHDVVVRLTRG